MAIEVFNRYENKFLLDEFTYRGIQDELLEHMELDEYNKNNSFYTISNIYFDTEDNSMIRHSLAKPKYKEKLRLRAYGVPKVDSKVYLEIKKKFCGLVNKRRTTIRISDAYRFVCTGEKPELQDFMNGQVVSEIEYILKMHELVPKLYLAYDRRAMFCRDDHDLRITFDTNIRTRRNDLRLENGDYGEALLDGGQWLMEVKAAKSIPVWLSQMLSQNKIYSTSFSKYGTEYQKFLQNSLNEKRNKNSEGEKIICSNRFSPQLQLIPQYR